MGRVVCCFVSLSSVTQALLKSRRGRGHSYGDSSSQVTSVENGQVVHSVCECADAASGDGKKTTAQQQHTPQNSLSPQPVWRPGSYSSC